MSGLVLLRPVAAAGLLAVLDRLRVQGTADDLVANARQVLHAATAHEHDRVLLQVVTLARDVRGDLDLVREAHTRDLAERGVRLLRGGRVDARAHAPPLRAPLEGRGLGLLDLVLAAPADQLLNGGHSSLWLVSCSSCSLRLFDVSPAPHGHRPWIAGPGVPSGRSPRDRHRRRSRSPPLTREGAAQQPDRAGHRTRRYPARRRGVTGGSGSGRGGTSRRTLRALEGPEGPPYRRR